MKPLALAFLASLALTSCATAGQLRNTFTFPAFEASVTGPDTCAAGSVAEQDTLTARRTWTGPVNGNDLLVGLPGSAAVMLAAVPAGTYFVTVVIYDKAGNPSCAATIMSVVRGKPAKIQNLSGAMLNPRKLPELLAVLEP